MPNQENLIDVEIVPADGSGDSVEFEGVNYISFISSPGGNSGGTYGIPALISEDRVKRELPVRILYVNPDKVVAMLATRRQ